MRDYGRGLKMNVKELVELAKQKKYNDFCKEIGIDQGACRSCVPVVKADENGNLKKEEPQSK